ncbi:MAG: PEGA domain-containing protein [Gallionella sp.]|nr:PEGA domain-containing protein [Gallionella sp.]
MEKTTNKTVMSSVLFLDIVAYSKKSVAVQIAQKELFNSLLSRAMSAIPTNDRVILDTGDGAAVTFLGDVEDALKVVLAFRESLLSEGAAVDPPVQVCMGINLGPVRLVKDINGHVNIVGDGINVAQRIMGFAQPGQILVSRSYFEGASRLSHEYAGMFYYGGMRADKHQREHEIYAIVQPGEDVPAQFAGEDTLGVAVDFSAGDDVREAPENWLQIAIATLHSASDLQRALYVGIVGVALTILIVGTVKIVHRPEAPEPQVVAQAPEPESKVVMQAPGPQIEPVSAPSLDMEFQDDAIFSDPAFTEPARDEFAARPATPAAVARKQQNTAQTQAIEQKSVVNNVSIAVSPWGEVYLDGKKRGVSPPLDGIYVTPGEHLIEIRNSTFPPYTQNIYVKAGESLKIKHKFTNKTEGEGK